MDSSSWDWTKFKWEVRDAEIKLKEIIRWIERRENFEKAKETGGDEDATASARYIYDYAMKLEPKLKQLRNH